jgi:hypothetical protein
MSIVDSFATLAACAGSAVLLCAGTAKHAVPGPAVRAVAGTLPRLSPYALPLIRAVATLELLIAAGLLLSFTARIAALGLTLTGAGFAAVGVAGVRARDPQPCGCFGRSTGRPFGLPSIGAGLLLAVAGVLALRHPPAGSPALALITGGLAVLVTAALYRDLITSVIAAGRRGRPATTRGADL